MQLEIIPCTHAVKCKEHQLFYKLAEELKEVQQAAIDIETGIREQLRWVSCMQLIGRRQRRW